MLATLHDEDLRCVLLGRARLIFGELRGEFRFPAEEAFVLERPSASGDTVVSHRVAVSRVVIGGLLTFGLIQAIGEYTPQRGARSGRAVINLRLLRALQRAGVPLHETPPAFVIHLTDGLLSGDFSHSDPFVPVYGPTDEIGPSVERAIARYRGAGG